MENQLSDEQLRGKVVDIVEGAEKETEESKRFEKLGRAISERDETDKELKKERAKLQAQHDKKVSELREEAQRDMKAGGSGKEATAKRIVLQGGLPPK